MVLDDRYKIVSLLGQGHSSLVYKADHLLMKRTVAIKILKVDVASNEQSLKRFQREAKAISSLTHPNIVSIYDFGITADNTPYLVMDCLNGESLTALLEREHLLPPERATAIFRQVCQALSYAHSKDIIHRDVKPSNLMVLKSDTGGDTVKVIDFGIAKLLAPDQAQDLTRTSEHFGSPIYMSPEQCLGRQLDARSDIYSLGCVMYEALTGCKPFAGTTPSETVAKHVTQSAPAFSVANSGAIVSSQLEAIVRKTLEKNPDQRFQSMNELDTALAPIGGGNKKAAQASRDELRRLALPAAILTSCIAALLLVSLNSDAQLFIWKLVVQMEESFNSNNDENFNKQLLSQMDALAATCNNRGRVQDALSIYKRMIPLASKHWDKFRQADLYSNIGILYKQLGDKQSANQYCDKAIALTNEMVSSAHDTRDLYDIFKKQLTVALAVRGSDSKETAVASRLLAHECVQLKKIDEAQRYAEEARRIGEAHRGSIEDLNWTYYVLTEVYNAKKDWAQAEKYAKLAIKFAEANYFFEGNNCYIADSYRVMGLTYLQEGKLDESKEYLLRSLATTLKARDQKHPRVANQKVMIATDMKKLVVRLERRGRTKDADEIKRLIQEFEPAH